MSNIMDEISGATQATETVEAVKIGVESVEAPKSMGIDFSGIINILKAKSSEKPVEEYTEHPLNYDKKKSTGRVIRGLEGLLGALNYAIVDLIMGLIEKSKEGKIGA